MVVSLRVTARSLTLMRIAMGTDGRSEREAKLRTLIPQMMAKAVNGTKVEDAIKFAEDQLKTIYK